MIIPDSSHIKFTKEKNWIIATDSVSNVASQGKNRSEALSNLREALELYYEPISKDCLDSGNS